MPDENEKPNQAEQIKVPGELTAQTADHDPRPWLTAEPGKKRKLRWFVVAPVLIILFGLGSWAVYALWYQNPDKVVMDALAGAISSRTFQASGTAITTATPSDSTVTFDGKFGYKEGAVLKLTNAWLSDAILTSSGDMYLKGNNLSNIYNGAINNAISSTKDNPLERGAVSALDTIIGAKIKTLDGKWVRISPDDFKSFNGAYTDAYKCFHDAAVGVGGNATELIEIGLKYNSHRFLEVEKSLPPRAGNLGYEVGINSTQLKEFVVSLKSTKLFKDINACAVDAGMTINLDDVDVKPVPQKAELWISRFSHQLKEVKVVSTSSAIDMTTSFNVPVKADAPKDFVPFTSVLPSVTSLLNASMLQNFQTDLNNR